MASKLMVCHALVSSPMKRSLWIGVGAADITKLKANGYYTVAVSVSDAPYHSNPVC